MPDQKKRQGGGSKLARSQTVTVRLDPKLRYLAELAARKQRRTLSSYVEWAIEESLEQVFLKQTADNLPLSVAGEADTVWDVDEPDRFVKLAFNYPEMLTHEEQILWKLIQENGSVWRRRHRNLNEQVTWEVTASNLSLEWLREHWADFKAVAAGEAEPLVLPTWSEPDKNKTPGHDPYL